MGGQFIDVFLQMVALFIIVGVGYLAKKIGWMTTDLDKSLSKLVLNTVLPAMILAAALDADTLPTLEQLGAGAFFALCCYAILCAMAFIITFALRIKPGNQGVFRFMMLFGNVGFIGFPVITALFGSGALIYASIFQIPFNFLVFTIGIWFIAQDNESGVKVKMSVKNFISPCLVSCLVTITLTILGIHGVPLLGDVCSTMGAMTTPASLLIIGSSLANLPVRDLFGGPKLWIASACRLLLIPGIVWLALGPFVGDPVILGVFVVLCGMPVATNGTMLCYEYGGNPKTMAQGTFITTVCSMVTIPLLMILLA